MLANKIALFPSKRSAGSENHDAQQNQNFAGDKKEKKPIEQFAEHSKSGCAP